jgi:FeoB-associated Cys-rich membrane protein
MLSEIFMVWQLILVALCVAAAFGYLGWTTWQSWRGGKSGCGGGCACPGKQGTSVEKDGTAHLIPVEQITLRRRPPG